MSWQRHRQNTKRKLDAVIGPLVQKRYNHEHGYGPALEQWELDMLEEGRRWIDEFCSPARTHNVRFEIQRMSHITWAFLDNEPKCDEETRWDMINIGFEIAKDCIEKDSPGILVELPQAEDALV